MKTHTKTLKKYITVRFKMAVIKLNSYSIFFL